MPENRESVDPSIQAETSKASQKAEKPFLTAKGFGELGSLLNRGQDSEKKSTPETKVSSDFFEKTLKGKFEKVPKGNFPSTLPEITSITITPFANEATGQKIIYAKLYYQNENSKEAGANFSIFENGTISGQIPRGLKLSREQIESEILGTIERENIDFWHQTDYDILPFTDEAEERESVGKKTVESKPVLTDPERLRFFEEQPEVLFGFLKKSEGFDGYRGFVFPKFVVLENEKKQNAAFIVDLEEKIETEGKKLTDIERDRILEIYWKPIAAKAKTKGQLVNIGAKRIIHTPETWKEKIKKELELRLAATA